MPLNVPKLALHRFPKEKLDPTLAPLPRTDEVVELASRFGSAHGAETAKLACLWHLATRLLSQFGAEHGTDLRGLVDLLHRSLLSQAAGVGIAPIEVQAALRDLLRAGETAAVLHSLPE